MNERVSVLVWRRRAAHRVSLIVAIALMCVPGLGRAAQPPGLRVPAVLGDHMVLQAGLPVPVWGWAEAGAEITVSFAGQTAKATAGADGRWQVRLAAMPASAEGRELRIQSNRDAAPRVLADVLVGEVWVCSGQSNMQFGLGGANRGQEEIAAADYPRLRLFTVPNVTAPQPADDCAAGWRVCSPESAGGFSAVGYFFGRHLHRQLDVPVGLINTSWGGTVAEAWTSGPALRAELPEFAPDLDKLAVRNEETEKAMARYEEAMAAYNAALAELYAREDDPAPAAARHAGLDVDDTAWKTMNVPANWETSPDFPDLDGIVWFRKTIELPAAWAGKDVILKPGPIDEVDQTWFNGERVGGRGNMRRHETQFWNVPREYPVPGRLVRAGRNVVAVRAMDAVGQGGLWGGAPDSMVAVLADGSDATRIPLAGAWRCQAEYVLPRRPAAPNNPNYPSVLFNGMINPLIPYAVRGAIWYQGESNAGRAAQYRTLLPTLITDWRTRWDSGEFPFLIVQLANFMGRAATPQESAWAELREAQAMTVSALPKVGLAVAIDIGEANDIHPRNKQDVGLRLGLAAQALAYNQDIEYSGPVFAEMKVEAGKALLRFTHAEGGLVAKDGAPTGFAIAGADRKFVWAKAEIRGDSMAVWADEVPEPVAVRYAWADNPACNLYNQAGLPMIPFRTDRP
ncbi:MAG: Glycosyl hydrolases family 2, sugar binding domain [Lentisphaerae bacterium ADurb.BinA184]|nr:MAG: Glycosyl hydrolases family 2, sugar binding domain [Lentisphaerae bacterium ADurb.BinA184]